MSHTRTEPENIILFHSLWSKSWHSIATWGRELPQSKFEKVKRTTNEEKNKDVRYKEGSSSLPRVMFVIIIVIIIFVFVVVIIVVFVDDQGIKDVQYQDPEYSLVVETIDNLNYLVCG